MKWSEQQPVHSFDGSLKASHEASNWPGWEPLYRDVFHPRFKTMIDFREDGPHQRAGIDRMIILSTAEVVLVDEKVRGRSKNGAPYSDIFLETVSDVERCSPGWIVKPLRAQYIAYLNAPLGTCYLLPVVQVQAAWARYGELWTEQFGELDSFNNGWTTRGVPVPVKDLYSSIGAALRIKFEPFEFAVRS